MAGKMKRLFAVLLALALLGALPLTQVIAAPPDVIDASVEIKTGGTFYLAPEAQALTITIATTQEVILVGNGCDYEVHEPNEDVFIDCTVQGARLTLSNVWLGINPLAEQSMLSFTGVGNTLKIDGINVLDFNTEHNENAAIHVPFGAALTVSGPGALYLYKNTMGAGIGGNEKERGGTIAINNLTLFGKGTMQGALIGNGANTSGAISGMTPGSISITGSELYLVANSRGAAIGGGAGSVATPGGNVSITGSTVAINVDFSGAAIGGGGYNGGNDRPGGTLVAERSSIKAFIDLNAVGQWGWTGVTEMGVNGNAAVTAEVFNGYDDDVYPLALDTSELGINTADGVTVVELTGGVPMTVYSGPLHRFRYVFDDFDRDDGNGGTIPTNVEYTRDNWTDAEDESLYLYLTGENHTLLVDGVTVEVVWKNGAFVVGGEPEPEIMLGDVDGDGSVTLNDSVLVRQAVMSGTIGALTPAQKLSSDVDGDGSVTLNDATIISQYVMRVITTFPADGGD